MSEEFIKIDAIENDEVVATTVCRNGSYFIFEALMEYLSNRFGNSIDVMRFDVFEDRYFPVVSSHLSSKEIYKIPSMNKVHFKKSRNFP